MKLLKTKLATAMAMVIVSGTGVANWTDSALATTDFIVQDKAITARTAATDMEYTVEPGEAVSPGDVLRFTMIGGGVWATAPVLTLSGGAADPGVISGADVTYFVTAAISAGDTIELDTLASPRMDLSAMALASDLQVAYTLLDAVDGITPKHGTDTTGVIASGINLLTCSATNTSVTDSITAASNYSLFSTAVATSTFFPSWSFQSNNTSTINTTNADIPTGDLVLMADSINSNTGNQTTGMLAYTNALAGSGASFGGPSTPFVPNPGLPQTLANPAGVDGAVAIVHVIDPEVTLTSTNSPAHKVTYSVMVKESSSWETQTLAGCLGGDPTFTATHDGSEFSSNSFGTSNLLRISDMSGTLDAAGARVRIEGFERNGTPVTHTFPTVVVPNNGTAVIKGADLMPHFSAYPDRIDFTVESEEIEASNIKRTEGANGSVTKNTTVYRSSTRNNVI